MTEVMVNVVATDPGTRKLIPYDKEKYGSNESTSKQLNVNKVGDDYSIVLRDDIFERMDPEQLMGQICKIIKANIKDDIGLSVNYIFVKDQDRERITSKIDQIDVMMKDSTWSALYPDVFYRPIHDSGDDMEDSGEITFHSRDGVELPMVDIEPDQAVEEIMRQLSGNGTVKKVPDKITSPGGVQLVRNEADLNPNSPVYLREMYQAGYNGKPDDPFDFYDDDDPEWDVPTSRVLNRAKHPKRDIDRHGIILVKDKKSLVKDYKQLLPIVKEFIPGNSKKIRKFQKEVAKSWVKSYAMTYAEAKEIEKELRKEERKSFGVAEAAESIASSLFGKK